MIVDIESDPRHAGQVERYHTWPVIRRQPVSAHTWQTLRIMMTVDLGMCTTRLMHYAVLHDVGEMAGDIPWPGKRRYPKLREGMREAEADIHARMTARWGLPKLPDLSPAELAFFKACENLEMWEFGLQEYNMGNKYAAVIASRMLGAVMEDMTRLPTDVQDRIASYVAARQAQESETELVGVTDPRHPNPHGVNAPREFVEREERRG